MKKQTTIKAIKNNYTTFRCGYKELQNIMYFTDADFYNAGVYGWNCDVYVSGNIAITTGYRYTTGIRIPDELIKLYDAGAKNILNSILTTDTKKACMQELVRDFYGELRGLINQG